MRHSLRLQFATAVFLFMAAATLARAEEVCKDSPVPDGYLVTDDRHDDSKCGPNYTSIRNVWVLARYDEKRTGTVIDVCSFNLTPKGWVEIDHRHDTSACSPGVQGTNVKTIKKLK